MEKQIATFATDALNATAQPLTNLAQLHEFTSMLTERMVLEKTNWISAKHFRQNIQVGVVRAELRQGKFSEPIIIINPENITFSGPFLSRMETDLSFPNLKLSVLRRAEVDMDYVDEHGNAVRQKFIGQMARSVIQLLDQLQGNLMIQHVNGHRKRSLKGYLKRLERNINQDSKPKKESIN